MKIGRNQECPCGSGFKYKRCCLNGTINEELKKLAKEWQLDKLCIPIEANATEKVPIFELLNSSLKERHKRNALLLPDFSNAESVFIFSDYGGESKGSKFNTYSFLFIDYNNIGMFVEKMKIIREKYGLDKPLKEIAFKDLHYGPINRSIEEYIISANNLINGLLFTLVVDKDVKSINSTNSKEGIKKLSQYLFENGYGNWKPLVAEKLLRITSIIAYFSKLLIPNKKKILWYTDHDSIVANEEISNNAGKVLIDSIRAVKNCNEYDTIGFLSHPFDNKDMTFLTDLLSLCDLAAGSLEHYLTRQKDMHEHEFNVKEEADMFLEWLGYQGIGLNKLTMHVNAEGDSLKAGFVEFISDRPVLRTSEVEVEYNTVNNNSFEEGYNY